jgi:hypothetical protein
LAESLPPALDRKLGYFGNARFVLFYYEPRGHEVIWNDGRSYGFARGGWMSFEDDVAPVAARHKTDIGAADHHGEHVLVLDRKLEQSYFANRAVAERFVSEQATVKG